MKKIHDGNILCVSNCSTSSNYHYTSIINISTWKFHTMCSWLLIRLAFPAGSHRIMFLHILSCKLLVDGLFPCTVDRDTFILPGPHILDIINCWNISFQDLHMFALSELNISICIMEH